MFGYIARKVFGSVNDRMINSVKQTVSKINSLEAEFQNLSDDQLKAKTNIFKQRLEAKESLDNLLPEAFATVRETAKRLLNNRHFDVQLIGGIMIHRGMIAEMKTGEGKTLVSTLPVYLNAITGKGVHVVTVNDYLAKRDAEWMGQIYKFLGLSVECITNDTPEAERKQAYLADITYGTNNEFGFDYLRDNLKFHKENMVQRSFNYAVIDEIDSILIDEARTPLIISGPTDINSNMYSKIDKLIAKLEKDDYELDEKSKSVSLTDLGNEKIEKLLKDSSIIDGKTSLFDIENMDIVHHVNQALKAHKTLKNDTDYIVKDGKVYIIDEFTGRIMDGRRYSEGLHQAIEAKEKLKIQEENQTLASITFQNYFRMYPKLSGMTGTAMTEANEFLDIYKLKSVEIPTNIAVTRLDEEDVIFKTTKEKYKAIINEIKEANTKKQPVLIGTISIEKSEHLSQLLKKESIKHNVLNAKFHKKEAEIIAQAGVPGAITISTNMAGRGTDIKLGGNAEMMIQQEINKGSYHDIDDVKKRITEQVESDKEKVLQAGGLFVIGTERHESRRIDNQLRGRSGRQGDPGKTKFYLSLEDDLMRIFGSAKISSFLGKLGLKDDEAIVHSWLTKTVEKAQHKVESRNYEIRKNLLKYDDVMNEQRKVIYEQRLSIMSSKDLTNDLLNTIEELIKNTVDRFMPKGSHPEEWNINDLEKELFRIFGIHINIDKTKLTKISNVNDFIITEVKKNIEAKKEQYGDTVFQHAIQQIFLVSLDHMWKDHLHSLDRIKVGINLRAYAQKDPLNEYKMEAFLLFEQMLSDLDETIVSRASQLQISHDIEEINDNSMMANIIESRTDVNSILKNSSKALPTANPSLNIPLKTKTKKEERDKNDPSTWGKISRNELCPCKSGKKYKHCHGAIS